MPKNREEIKNEVDKFFENLKDKTPEQIRKIKKKAMSINFKLGKLKRRFCQKCYRIYNFNDKIRIKNNLKVIVCSNCGTKRRWAIK
ncbi:hypothetical protein J4447_04075 [Candidatus Pacearchaeota archaeon]|nr:hypothetical protein [Candidatus Pacearchaeota archaeon]